MKLINLENLLEIKIAKEKEPIYQARLDAAINLAQVYCGNDFKNKAGELEIPAGAQMGIALIAKSMGEKNQNVASQSLGDMSKSFFQNGTYSASVPYLNPYRKVRYA